MNKEEKDYLAQKILALNNNIFRQELFNFDVLDNYRFDIINFELCNYEYVPNDFLWSRTDKKRAKDKYKTNRRKRLTRQELSLLNFFKQLGVLK